MAIPARAAARPYNRFLNSALHRRFIHASALGVLLSWDNAIWISNKRSCMLPCSPDPFRMLTLAGLWFWFPLGPAGLRTALLFASCLAIFMLQLATITTGKRTSKSPFHTLRTALFSLSTLQIFFWYLVSAWCFGEIYILSSADSARLSWVQKSDISNVDKLNERPIYLRAIFIILALVQAVKHVYWDNSSICILITTTPANGSDDMRTHHTGSLSSRFQRALLPVMQNALVTSSSVAVVGPFVYTLFLRNTFWYCHLQLAKPFYNLARSDVRATGYPPSNPILMLRSFAAGFLLIFTWEAISLIFTTLMNQQPLKKGQPLSAASKDPNGTLVSGLKAKRELVKSFAFWELAIIAENFPERRKQIFADIDGVNGPCWAQMVAAGLNVIRNISDRIAATKASPSQEIPDESMEIAPLPSIVQKISNQSITMSKPPPLTTGYKLEAAFGSVARMLGSAAHPWSPPVGNVVGILEVPAVKESWSSNFHGDFVTWFFRSTNSGKIKSAVLGATTSEASVIVDAIDGITKMLVSSLAEDPYGKAIVGVPDTVRIFTAAICDIEQLVQDNANGVEGNIDEVEIVVDRLKAGLSELLSAFQLFLKDVGLGIGELNAAKRAVEKRALVPETETKRSAAVEGTLGTREKSSAFEAGRQRSSTRQRSGDRPRSPKPARKTSEKERGKEDERPSQRIEGRQNTRQRDWNGLLGQPAQQREMAMAR